MAILKAGGAYVPLDPGYPRERLDYLLADTGVPVLVTEEKRLAAFGEDATLPGTRRPAGLRSGRHRRSPRDGP